MLRKKLCYFISLGFAIFSSSVKGREVNEVDIFYVVEYHKALEYDANPLCSVTTVSPNQDDGKAIAELRKGITYPLNRSGFGLALYGLRLWNKYVQKTKQVSPKDLQYAASLIKTQSAPLTDLESQLECVSLVMELGLRGGTFQVPSSVSGVSSHRSFAEGMCSCALNTETYCTAVVNWQRETQCLSNYAYYDERETCQHLKAENDFGFKWNPSCFRSVSPGFEPTQMALTNMVLREPLPATIDPGIVQSEGRSYFQAYLAGEHLLRFAESTLLNCDETRIQVARNLQKDTRSAEGPGILRFADGTVPMSEILPGWTTLKILYQNEVYDDAGRLRRLPTIVLAYSASSTSFLVVVREALSTFDARVGGTHDQVFRYLYGFPGVVNNAAGTIYQAAFGVLDMSIYKKLSKLGADLRALDSVKITVVGKGPHGGTAAMVLANHFRGSFEALLSPGALQVDCIAFGAPLVGDKDFIDSLASNVNLRNIVIEGDPYVGAFPCSKSFTCNEDYLPARTGLKSGEPIEYTATPGLVLVSMEDLHRASGNVPEWAMPKAMFELAAIHTCGYKCWLTGAFCKSDVGEMGSMCSSEMGCQLLLIS